MDNSKSNFRQVEIKEAEALFDTPLQTILDPDDRVMSLPQITEDGPPNRILSDCPGDRVLDYMTFWYHIQNMPDLLIYTHCHNTYIIGTSLETSFGKVQKPTGKCAFNVPRIIKELLPEALRTSQLQSIKAYMLKRRKILDCKGQNGTTIKDGIKWFKLVRSEIEVFVACEACYEDVVLCTSFAFRFGPVDFEQPANHRWFCDICNPFIQRSLLKYSTKPNGWNDWVAAGIGRLRLKDCQGEAVEIASRQWFRMRCAIKDFDFCETCYLDKIALTVLEYDFEIIPQEGDVSVRSQLFDLLLAQQSKQTLRSCNGHDISTSVAIEVAVARKDINVLWNAARTIATNQACSPRGIIGGAWYTLVGGCSNFQICAGCLAGFVTPLNLNRFFQHAQKIPHNQSRTSSMNV